MVKNDNPSQSQHASRDLNEEQQALVKALTEAIIAANRDAPPPHEAAIAAAYQYGQIKGALRTHSEPMPTVSPVGTATNTGN
jgi:hypothetical protein